MDDNTQNPIEENTIEEENTEEEVIGEHDIVIDDDFEFKLEVAEVSNDIGLFENKDNSKEDKPLDLGTEQSGNITF